MEYIGLEFQTSGRNNFIWSVGNIYYKIKRAGPVLWKLHVCMWLLRVPSRQKARSRLMQDTLQGTANPEKQLRISDWLGLDCRIQYRHFSGFTRLHKDNHLSLPAFSFSFLFWLLSGPASN